MSTSPRKLTAGAEQEERFAVFVCSPQPRGELPSTFEVNYTGFNDDLGVRDLCPSSEACLDSARSQEYSIQAHAPSLVVSGAISVTLTLHKLLLPTIISEYAVYIEQEYELHCGPATGRRVVPPPTRKLVFRRLDRHAPLTLPPGDRYVDTHYDRMPDANAIRPSTHYATKSPIRVASALVVEITYETSECSRKTLRFSKPVDIASVRTPASLAMPN